MYGGGEFVSYEMSPEFISKIEMIIDNDIETMGLIAEIAEDIGDPIIRALLTSIIGDENGHVRFFRLLMSPITTRTQTRKNSSQELISARTKVGKKYSLDFKQNKNTI